MSNEALDIETVCFQIIAFAGTARTKYIEAAASARQHRFEEAQLLIDEGDEAFSRAHDVHAKLLQEDAAANEGIDFNILLLHSEDQLMSAETIKIMTLEIMHVYQQISNK